MLLICLATSLSASAGSSESPELVDAAGDAGAAGLAMGPAASSVDIVRAWFAPAGAATDVHLETAGGEGRGPNMVLSLTFDVGDITVFVGYGHVLMPSGITESFIACASSAGDHADGECQDIDGEARPDGAGFRADVPMEWLPPGATASDLRARAYVLVPPVGPAARLHAVGPTFDEAGPGTSYRVPDEPAPDQASAVQVASAEAGRSRDVPGVHAFVGILATLVAALIWVRRA